MAKAPRLGSVKSRLAREVGAVEAARFYRASAGHALRRLAADPRWCTILALTPDAAIAGPWPTGVLRTGQGGGGLGTRMQRYMDILPPGPVVIVGSDIALLRPAHVARAFRLLGGHDAVIGPARDGGYWLVGLRRSPKVLRPFGGVRWSGPHALADTLANLRGRRIALADTLEDVDDADSHRRLSGAGARLVQPPDRRR